MQTSKEQFTPAALASRTNDVFAIARSATAESTDRSMKKPSLLEMCANPCPASLGRTGGRLQWKYGGRSRIKDEFVSKADDSAANIVVSQS